MSLHGKDVAQRLVRLVLEKFWLRVIRLAKNPSGTARGASVIDLTYSSRACESSKDLPETSHRDELELK